MSLFVSVYIVFPVTSYRPLLHFHMSEAKNKVCFVRFEFKFTIFLRALLLNDKHSTNHYIFTAYTFVN